MPFYGAASVGQPDRIGNELEFWLLLFRYSFITRHSLVRAKGEVLVLLCFLLVFLSMISWQPRADSRQILHAGVLWFRYVFSPFGGYRPRGGGRKKGEMKFSWKTYVECEWRVCVSSTDALVIIIIIKYI